MQVRITGAPMHPFKAIGLKLISALLFAGMSALVRQLGDVAPIGQMVFFRSAFAILPVLVIYALRGELASAVRTGRPFGQLGRGMLSVCGMFTNFSALTRLAARRCNRDLVCVAAHYCCAGCRHLEGARAHLPMVGSGDRLCRRDRDARSAFRLGGLCRRGRRGRRSGLAVCDHLGLLQRRHRYPDPPAYPD